MVYFVVSSGVSSLLLLHSSQVPIIIFESKQWNSLTPLMSQSTGGGQCACRCHVKLMNFSTLQVGYGSLVQQTIGRVRVTTPFLDWNLLSAASAWPPKQTAHAADEVCGVNNRRISAVRNHWREAGLCACRSFIVTSSWLLSSVGTGFVDLCTYTMEVVFTHESCFHLADR